MSPLLVLNKNMAINVTGPFMSSAGLPLKVSLAAGSQPGSASAASPCGSKRGFPLWPLCPHTRNQEVSWRRGRGGRFAWILLILLLLICLAFAKPLLGLSGAVLGPEDTLMGHFQFWPTGGYCIWRRPMRGPVMTTPVIKALIAIRRRP